MAPNSAALAVAKIYPEEERPQKITLDIGAGTGLLAEEVRLNPPPPPNKKILYRASVEAKYIISGEVCRLLGYAWNNQCLNESVLADLFLLFLLHTDTNLVHINYWLENLKRCTSIFFWGGGRGEIGAENIFFSYTMWMDGKKVAKMTFHSVVMKCFELISLFFLTSFLIWI